MFVETMVLKVVMSVLRVIMKNKADALLFCLQFTKDCYIIKIVSNETESEVPNGIHGNGC